MQTNSNLRSQTSPQSYKKLGSQCIIKIKVDNLLQRHNLLKPESERVLTRPHRLYKDAVIDIFAVLSALMVGYLYKLYIADGVGVWILGSAVLLYAMLSVLHVFFTPSLGRRIGITLLSLLGILIFFYTLPLPTLATAGGTAFFFLFWGFIAARRQLDNSLHIRFFSAVRTYATKFVTAMVLLGIVLYFPEWSGNNFLLSRKNYDFFMSSTAGFTTRLYPGVNFDASFREFATDLIRQSAEENSEFQALSPEARHASLAQSVDSLLTSLKEKFGFVVTGEETARDAIYNFVNGFIERWRTQFGDFFVVGWLLVVFLVVRSFGALFVWVISGATFLAYETLIAANVIKIVSIDTNQESIEYT